MSYMNSVLQQLYNIPQFRYSILDVDDHRLPNIGPREIDDNVLHPMQHMFGYLELSERQTCNPACFCSFFKNYSGKPIDPFSQQCAHEFFNLFFKNIENALKSTSHRQLLQGVFGGKTVTQCICKTCGTTKENREDFYTLSLDVKHSKTLAESLQRFISGDKISDYMCENCNKYVEITKRNLIESTPNILILHLERIVFTLDGFVNEKINTRLEFPNTLDLHPYTKACIEKPESSTVDFQYDLIGVVVYKGTVDMGNYYSIIKTDQNKWFVFNDSIGRSFK